MLIFLLFWICVSFSFLFCLLFGTWTLARRLFRFNIWCVFGNHFLFVYNAFVIFFFDILIGFWPLFNDFFLVCDRMEIGWVWIFNAFNCYIEIVVGKKSIFRRKNQFSMGKIKIPRKTLSLLRKNCPIWDF